MAASEAHGVITGVACTPSSKDAWVKVVFADVDPTADSMDAERLLGVLRAQTQTRLTERESDFAPLLPADDSSLGARVAALADFCSGYLLGLVAGGVSDLAKLPGDAREVVNDFVKIAQAEADTESVATEVEEQALLELVEYVRVGVQLIYEELHSAD